MLETNKTFRLHTLLLHQLSHCLLIPQYGCKVLIFQPPRARWQACWETEWWLPADSRQEPGSNSSTEENVFFWALVILG